MSLSGQVSTGLVVRKETCIRLLPDHGANDAHDTVQANGDAIPGAAVCSGQDLRSK